MEKNKTKPIDVLALYVNRGSRESYYRKAVEEILYKHEMGMFILKDYENFYKLKE